MSNPNTSSTDAPAFYTVKSTFDFYSELNVRRGYTHEYLYSLAEILYRNKMLEAPKKPVCPNCHGKGSFHKRGRCRRCSGTGCLALLASDYIKAKKVQVEALRIFWRGLKICIAFAEEELRLKEQELPVHQRTTVRNNGNAIRALVSYLAELKSTEDKGKALTEELKGA
jgi:hypothetical protein